VLKFHRSQTPRLDDIRLFRNLEMAPYRNARVQKSSIYTRAHWQKHWRRSRKRTPPHLQWYGVANSARAHVCVCVLREFDLRNNVRGHLSNSGQVRYFVRCPSTAARTISQPLARYAAHALRSPLQAYTQYEKSTRAPLHATILTRQNAFRVMKVLYSGPILHRWFFSIIWTHIDLEILAIVARAQYKRICLRLNNSDVCRSTPNNSGNWVHNIYHCNAPESNAYGSTLLWRGVPQENMKFYRNDRFHANHIRLAQHCTRPSQQTRQLNEVFRPLGGSAYPRARYLSAAGTQQARYGAYEWAPKFDSHRLLRFQRPPSAKREGIQGTFLYVITENVTFLQYW